MVADSLGLREGVDWSYPLELDLVVRVVLVLIPDGVVIVRADELLLSWLTTKSVHIIQSNQSTVMLSHVP